MSLGERGLSGGWQVCGPRFPHLLPQETLGRTFRWHSGVISLTQVGYIFLGEETCLENCRLDLGKTCRIARCKNLSSMETSPIVLTWDVQVTSEQKIGN